MAGRIADGASRPQGRLGWLGRLLRRRPSGIRVRLTLLAVLVVGAGLVLASVVVLALARNDLTGNARSAATERAQDTASQLASGVLPVLPGTSEDRPVLQIVDQHGTVLAASPELRGRGPCCRNARRIMRSAADCAGCRSVTALLTGRSVSRPTLPAARWPSMRLPHSNLSEKAWTPRSPHSLSRVR